MPKVQQVARGHSDGFLLIPDGRWHVDAFHFASQEQQRQVRRSHMSRVPCRERTRLAAGQSQHPRGSCSAGGRQGAGLDVAVPPSDDQAQPDPEGPQRLRQRTGQPR